MSDQALTEAQLESVLQAAVAAPSADNRHVFRWAWSGTSLILKSSREFVTSPPHRRVLGMISMGAVVENIALRASELGLAVAAHWQHSGPQPGFEVRLQFASEPVLSVEPLAREIERRHSNRQIKLEGPRLPIDVQQQFASDAGLRGDATLLWLDSPDQRRLALGLIRRAESERFGNRYLHQELFDSVRFDVGFKTNTTEGLPPGTLGLPAIERAFFPLLRYWPLQRILNLLGTHKLIGFRAADLPCRLAPHLGVISVADQSDASAVAAGSALQRVWLRASSLDLAFQVFAAAPIYALGGFDRIPQKLQLALAEGWQSLCGNGRPLVAFRLGHGATTSMRSGRVKPDQLRI